MTFASRYQALAVPVAWVAWCLALGLLALLVGAVRFPAQSQTMRAPERNAPPFEWSSAPDVSSVDWSVFRDTRTELPLTGSLVRRYRLAGTFLKYGAEVDNDRRAILNDQENDTESIVGEGDVLPDGVVVARILSDRIVLRDGAHEEQLRLMFNRSGGGDSGSQSSSPQDGSGNASGTDRFGAKRVGERRWVFDREKLMDYYRELMDNPDRLVKVFDSLHPMYDDEEKITGYELRIEGEPEFFDAIGFAEGDRVRRVNSVDMTNRRRAEFFIKQFVEGRASAFVLDLERGDESMKFTYQVR